jgi:cobalt/nickel transport protein
VSTRRVVVLGLLVSALLAGVVSFYASSHPDGLQQVAGTLGFDDSARDSATAGSPLAGYAVRDVGDARLSGGLAGLVGVVVVGLVMTGLLLLLRRRRGSTDPDA